MSPIQAHTRKYYQPTKTARTAAVLALLHGHPTNLQITLIKRSNHPEDQHAGQISFPGGGVDAIDQSLIACALRETEEETGVPCENIAILGALSPLYVYASDNMVYPFVGYLSETPSFAPDPKEVASVLNIPLSYLLQPEIISTTTIEVRGFELTNVPHYDINGQILWGATAMMMAELLSIWKKTSS